MSYTLFRKMRKDEDKKEYLEIIKNICKIRCDNRRFYGTKSYFFSDLVWNTLHPDDKKSRGDNFYIVHKDGDLLNEDISNLEKINKYEDKEKYLDEIKKTCRIRKGRRLYGKGKKPFSQLIWNIYHQENPIAKGDGYVIHHKNLDKLCDEIWNLQKLTKSEHVTLHNIGNKYSLGRTLSEEHKKRISKYNKGKIFTEEHRRKLSKCVVANFVEYGSVTEAAGVLSVALSTIVRRIKTHKPGYFYINKKGD